ncbi:hypothetical protein BpHYR1_038679 [Brachionus plicatilis]|uniref:Transposable element Tc3 transposase n=1 Tax=Brachionus plicatilis TaxID=10195 RepID=A0A3M7T3U9_BRAPC|nr:hypothetical protein BpHYR1_038679 [Brachionus plicatilis]
MMEINKRGRYRYNFLTNRVVQKWNRLSSNAANAMSVNIFKAFIDREVFGMAQGNACNGTGICKIYTGRINQFVYINTMENSLFPFVELLFEPDDPWIFQQDGDSAHTAQSVSDWFKEQNLWQIEVYDQFLMLKMIKSN